MITKERYDIVSFATLFEYPLAKKIAPFFNKLGMTPNQITTMNIFFRFYIIYVFLTSKRTDIYILAMLLFSQFLDALDGTVARMYNMVTKFGAMLDITSDMIFFSIIIGILLYKYYDVNVLHIIIILSIVVIMFNIKKIPLLKKYGNIEDIVGANSSLIIIILYFYVNPTLLNRLF